MYARHYLVLIALAIGPVWYFWIVCASASRLPLHFAVICTVWVLTSLSICTWGKEKYSMVMLLKFVTKNYDFFLLYCLHITSAISFYMDTKNKIWRKWVRKERRNNFSAASLDIYLHIYIYFVWSVDISSSQCFAICEFVGRFNIHSSEQFALYINSFDGSSIIKHVYIRTQVTLCCSKGHSYYHAREFIVRDKTDGMSDLICENNLTWYYLIC